MNRHCRPEAPDEKELEVLLGERVGDGLGRASESLTLDHLGECCRLANPRQVSR